MSEQFNVFRNVLTISTDSKSNGGIASVISVYEENIYPFNHITSTKSKTIIVNLLVLVKGIFLLFLRLLFDMKIKIIHIQGASYSSFHRKYIFFWISKYIFRKKIIYHIHGAEFHLFYKRASKKNKAKISRFLTEVDVVVCLSDEWKRFFSEGFSIKKIIVLNNVINKPTLISKSTDYKVVNFLFLGIIGERKGMWDILDVLKDHREEFIGHIKLNVGGNGEVKEFQERIKQDNLEELVNYIGWVKNEKKIEMLNKCHIYILPSYNEGLPISILEAMSYSMPIISTNVGGIPQVLNNYENGFLINPGNKEDIFKAISFFIKNKSKIKEFGEISHKKISPFYINSVKDKLASIYIELLR